MESDKTVIQPCCYVGIGASAGGLEALEELFSHLPNDTGAVFIVLQHLSPDYKSMMPQLLKKHTDMPIHQPEDGVVLKPNNIYLMPARKNMLISEEKLLISDSANDGHLHLPIDVFLSSLAEEKHERAIGIVLSGTGSDGTRGIKAIKESGGLVIIQDPPSAKFNGMPISAYNTGLADLVLTPAEIGTKLKNLIDHSKSTSSGKLKLSLEKNASYIDQIFSLLKQKSSINFSQYKASTLARRIERRLGINQLENLEEYIQLLINSPKELQTLAKELLIGVTRFFRDEDAFEYFAEKVVPKVVANALSGKQLIRGWIAGCSSGEEAYSMAILFDEYISKNKLNCEIKIFATDVDSDAIIEASCGRYSADIAQDMNQERLEKYFIHKDGAYHVKKHLRQKVIFSTHNLIEDPPFSNLDVVSCRNVLIYFQHTTQKKVLSSLFFSLQRDGYLFLGSSENLGDLSPHFQIINERAKIFRKASNHRIPFGSSPQGSSALLNNQSRAMMTVPTAVINNFNSNRINYLTCVSDRLIKEYAPDCIVLDENHDAVYVYGDLSDYTKGITPGKVTNQIKKMVVDDLNVAISTALFRCEKNEEDVYYKDVLIRGC